MDPEKTQAILELSRTHTLAEICREGYSHNEVTEAIYGLNARTPDGYDRRWVDAINHALVERGVGGVDGIRVQDLDVDLWNGYIGPLLDAIEERG